MVTVEVLLPLEAGVSAAGGSCARAVPMQARPHRYAPRRAPRRRASRAGATRALQSFATDRRARAAPVCSVAGTRATSSDRVRTTVATAWTARAPSSTRRLPHVAYSAHGARVGRRECAGHPRWRPARTRASASACVISAHADDPRHALTHHEHSIAVHSSMSLAVERRHVVGTGVAAASTAGSLSREAAIGELMIPIDCRLRR